MGVRCVDCGKEHSGDDLPDLGFDAPDPYLAVPKNERKKRTSFTKDRCTVKDEDGEHYFVRGVIDIPLIGKPGDSFGIGAWVSQSRVNFERYMRREEMEPTMGWLVNHMPFYAEETYLLKARLHFRGDGLRPAIELEPTDHPLAVDQRTGITIARAWEIVHGILPN